MAGPPKPSAKLAARKPETLRLAGISIEISTGMRRLIIATAAPWVIFWSIVFLYASFRLVALNHQYDDALAAYYRPAFADDRATEVELMASVADEMVGLRHWTLLAPIAGLGAPLAAVLAFVGNH